MFPRFTFKNMHDMISVKSVRIRSYTGPHFPAFGLTTEKYGGPFRIQSKWGKMRTRITPNTGTFDAVHSIALKKKKYYLLDKNISCKDLTFLIGN